jgi:soluble lytic murein transglycosylase
MGGSPPRFRVQTALFVFSVAGGLSAAGLLGVGCANQSPAPRLDGSVPVPALRQVPSLESVAELPSGTLASARAESNQDARQSAESKAWSRPPQSVAEAIRLRDFAAARALLDAAPAEERALPEMRYARARVAIELADAQAALDALESLEQLAPEFSGDVARLRVEAHRLAGHADEVVAYYGKRREPESWIIAARALANAERYVEARRWVDKAITALGKRRSLELRAEARALRARIAEAQGQRHQAISDYRWLAVEAPTTPAADGADGALVRFDGKLALTKYHRLDRARAFAEKGDARRAEAELESLKQAPGREPPEVDQVAVLAQALYRSRSNYARAAELYRRAAELSPKNRELHRYLEAKSLSRADKDPEAIAKYDELAKRVPGSQIGDDALYEAARLRFIDGLWSEAVSSYEGYLKRRGKTGRHVQSARYELAVARLAARDFDKAQGAFKALLADARRRTTSEREEARLLQLLGVAQEGAGNREAAVATYREVMQQEPLSFPALVAAARLAALGEPAGPFLSPAPEGPPLPALGVELPDRVAKLHRVGLDAEAEAALREHEDALEKRYGERSGEALCRAYGQLESARRRYQLAQRIVSRRVLNAAPGPATRWQWECVYPEPYAALIERAEKERELTPHWLHAVMRQESGFSPTVVSPADAVGLLQLIEPTARRVAAGLEVTFDAELMRAPAVNVRFGAYYLRELLNLFAGRIELAAAAYNAGPHAAGRWLAAGQELPLDVFVARIPYAETRTYVQRVLGNWARYAYLHGGEAAVPKLDLALPQGLAVPDDAY